MMLRHKDVDHIRILVHGPPEIVATMSRIISFEVFAAELPLKKPFKHAAAERHTSYSLFLKCTTGSGAVGFGECLPREYVSGESRDGAVTMLRERILPPLAGREFGAMEEVEDFLRQCDGKAPADWVDPAKPQTAAWCAVDLALLDAFGREFGQPVLDTGGKTFPRKVRYSGVTSADRGWKFVKRALRMRLFGLRSIKMKVDRETTEEDIRTARRSFGRGTDIRVDANMAWTVDQALEAMKMMAKYGIRSFEQPIAADNIAGLARLVKESGLGVMPDESFIDGDSLKRLIAEKACTAINLRISKNGGLIAAMARCEEALKAGMTVQLGCQVGESSLLSAAHLALITAMQGITYAEGCFGLHLLREDPVAPVIQFGYGGRPPTRPDGPGLGIRVDEDLLRKHSEQSFEVK